MNQPHGASATPPLSGRTVVVLGAAGEVGEGIVHQLARHGADVIAVSRSADRLLQLQHTLASVSAPLAGTVVTHVGDVGHENAAMALREGLLARHGTFDAVVASLGGWRQGLAVTDTPLSVWRETLDQSLTAHFLGARALLPVLADRGGASYTMINGGAALRAVPGAGAMCVSAAAQRMLAEALATEHHARPVRINALLLNAVVRTRSRSVAPKGTISADDVGTYASYLASGSARDVRGSTIVLEHAGDVHDLPVPFGLGADARATM